MDLINYEGVEYIVAFKSQGTKTNTSNNRKNICYCESV